MSKTKAVFVRTMVLISILLVLLSGCITPEDHPSLPSRGFYMGILPIPGDNQSFDDCYTQVASYAEFVPVWGKPSLFYDLAQDLQGPWGKTFVEDLTRGKGMFPLIHMNFYGEEMKLVTPPGVENATLNDSQWRAAYKSAVLNVVRVSHPLYLSLGNEVNRWYEHYGVNVSDANGFQHYVSLYEDIYDAVKNISPHTMVFCVFAREIVAEHR